MDIQRPVCTERKKVSSSVSFHLSPSTTGQALSPSTSLSSLYTEAVYCSEQADRARDSALLQTNKQSYIFRVTPLCLLMHAWDCWPHRFCLCLRCQLWLHMWVTLKRGVRGAFHSVTKINKNIRHWNTFFPAVNSNVQSNPRPPFSLFLITLLPPSAFYHLSYSFGIAVWHLALARHSQADDQCPPITRIYGSISPQLII